MTNFFKKTVAGAAVAAAIAFGGSASAATLDFTGYNLNNDYDAVTFTFGDLRVRVTAGTFSGSYINTSTRQVDLDPNGLGADASGDYDGIDGSNGNDVLIFSFNQAVTINSIGFSEIDSNDDFSFGEVFGNRYYRAFSYGDVEATTDLSFLGDNPLRTGYAFGIGAIGDYDNFRITSLDVSAVPLPASGLLLLAAMGAGVGVSRRRKKAAKA